MKLTQKELLLVLRKTDGRCLYCGLPNAYEIEHFIPKCLWYKLGYDCFSGESPDNLENLFLSCRSCNLSKGRKHPEDFIGWRMAWYRYAKANFNVGLIDQISFEMLTDSINLNLVLEHVQR